MSKPDWKEYDEFLYSLTLDELKEFCRERCKPTFNHELDKQIRATERHAKFILVKRLRREQDTQTSAG